MSDSDLNKAFAQRLSLACDQHPDVPPPRQGRQTWVSEKTKVSAEAVRKWFAGLSRPRPKVMALLAKELNVDEAWLALGLTPEKTPDERRRSERQAAGAVYYVAGAIELSGGKVAFPDPGEPGMDHVDIVAILGGRHLRMHVALAERLSPGHYRTVVPTNYRDMTVIAVVPTHGTAARLVVLPPEMIDAHAENQGGYLALEMIADQDTLLSGEDAWPTVTDFHNLPNRRSA